MASILRSIPTMALVTAALGLGCVARDARSSDAPGPPAGDRVAEAIATGRDVVVLRFTDSSVRPPWHRSHTITVTPTEIRRVVDAYGTLLDDRKHAIAPAVFEDAIAALERARVRAAAQPMHDGACPGSSSHRIVIERGDVIALDGELSSCPGDTGTLDGDVAAFVAAVERAADRELGKDKPARPGQRRRR